MSSSFEIREGWCQPVQDHGEKARHDADMEARRQAAVDDQDSVGAVIREAAERRRASRKRDTRHTAEVKTFSEGAVPLNTAEREAYNHARSSNPEPRGTGIRNRE